MLKDILIRQYLSKKIKQANNIIVNNKEYMQYISRYPDRTLAIYILTNDDSMDEVGFGINGNGQIVELSEVLDPTVTVRCSMRVFKALLAGKLTINQFVYERLGDFEGANLIRDKIILEGLFDGLIKAGVKL